MATFFDIDGSKCFHCTLCRVDMPADELYRPQNSYCKDCFKRAQRRFDAKKYTKNKARKAIFEIFFSLEEKLQKARAQSEKQAEKYYAQYANEIVHQERGFFNSLKCTQKC